MILSPSSKFTFGGVVWGWYSQTPSSLG